MSDDPLRSKFNEQDTFVKQMTEAEQRRLEAFQRDRAKSEQNMKERHEKEREKNIKREEANEFKKAGLNFNLPRPKHVPPPRMPSPEEIKELATTKVRNGEARELKDHKECHDLAEKKLIEKSLHREALYQQEQKRDR
jgi:hypothetical protein